MRNRSTALVAGIAAVALLRLVAPAEAVTLDLNPGDTITFNTITATYSGTVSGSGVIFNGVPVFAFDHISLPAGVTVNLTGSNPLSLISATDITVGAVLNGSATGQTARLGGGNGGDAGNPGQNGFGPLGNVGGGIHSVGGECCYGGGGGSYGGRGGSQTSGLVGQSGQIYGDAQITTLLGGSGGAGGGTCCWSGLPVGGGGGGAIGLSAADTITLLPSSQILVNGADGDPSTTNRTGGGGSGGAVKLAAPVVNIASGMTLSAAGGSSLPLGAIRAGGGGGGGRVAIFAGSLANSGTISVAGGAANNPDPDAPGSEAGDPGTLFTGGSGPALNYLASVLADHPIAYYRLGETSGTTAVDSIGPSPNGSHPGTYVGNPQLGQIGPRFNGMPADNLAPSFDGSGDGVQATGANAVPYGAGDYSIEIWFKVNYADINTTGRDLLSGTISGAHGTLLELNDVSGTKRLRFLHRSPTGGGGGQDIFFNLPGAGDPFYNNFHHLVAVKDDVTNGMALYLDGKLVGQNTATGVFSSDLDIAIGRLLPNNSSRDFLGFIDEVAIYDHALSAADVLEHFNAATVPEPSSMVLLGLGLLGLVCLGWRRR